MSDESTRVSAVDAAIAAGLTAADVAAMDLQQIADLDGTAWPPPMEWSGEAVQATAINTLASREEAARLEAARVAAEQAAREVLPSATVEVR